MVSAIVKLLNWKSNSVNEAALLLGLFTFISQLLGLIRDRFLATYVGAGSALDTYYAAFKIPDFLYVSVATLAAITVLLPFLSERYGDGNHEGRIRAKHFFDQVFTVLLMILVGLSVVLFIAMPWLAKLVAPGFDDAAIQSVTMISRIMLIQPIIIGISNMMSSVTQMFRKFFITALSPVFYNIGIILGIIFFYPTWGLKGLAYGVVLGAVLHMAIQVPVLIRQGFFPRITTSIDWVVIRKVFTTSIPRTIGLSMTTLTFLVLTAVASLLPEGSISIMSLTNNMLNVPLAIIGISYSVASFPSLVQFITKNEFELFARAIINSTRKIIFWSIPVVVLFIVLRAQIVRVILGSQSFSWDDTRIAAAALALFMLGLVGQSLIHLLARGYYAAGNTRRPLITNAIGAATTIVFAGIFVWMLGSVTWFEDGMRTILRLNEIADIRLLGLPLAFALGNTVNFFVLWNYFKKDFPKVSSYSLVRTVIQTIAASLCMGAVTYGSLNILVLVFNQSTFWGIFAQGLVAGLFGITIFITVLIMLRNEDMHDVVMTIKNKFWKTEVVVDQVGIDQG